MPMPEQLNPQRVIKGEKYTGTVVATRVGYDAPGKNPVVKPASPPALNGDSQNKGLGTQYPNAKSC